MTGQNVLLGHQNRDEEERCFKNNSKICGGMLNVFGQENKITVKQAGRICGTNDYDLDITEVDMGLHHISVTIR